MVPVSARTGQKLDLLLEMILLVAEMQELKANPNRPAPGTVLEAKMDRGRGPVATSADQQRHAPRGRLRALRRGLRQSAGDVRRPRQSGARRPARRRRSKSWAWTALPEVGDSSSRW
jgi:hypothetical protein